MKVTAGREHIEELRRRCFSVFMRQSQSLQIKDVHTYTDLWKTRFFQEFCDSFSKIAINAQTHQIVWAYLVEIYKLLIPLSPKSIKNEIILVTGGSNGIGREILLYLASLEKEITLISWDIDTKTNEELVKTLRNHGVSKAFSYTVDVGNADEVAAAATQVRKDAGEVTMLFNNAGVIGTTGKCWEMDVSEIRRTLDVNVLSSYITVKEFLPAMIRQNKGHVIMTNSMLGCIWVGHGSPYIASKYALKAFTYILGEELRKIQPNPDVHVTSVHPSYVQTNQSALTSRQTRFDFLLRVCSAPDAAKKIVERVLRNYEHIFVPDSSRWAALLFPFLPAGAAKAILDYIDMDPIRNHGESKKADGSILIKAKKRI